MTGRPEKAKGEHPVSGLHRLADASASREAAAFVPAAAAGEPSPGLLVQAQDRYADLYDLAPLGYVTLGPTGVIEDINAAGAVLLGHDRGRLIQKPFALFTASYYHAILDDHLIRCRETGYSTVEIQLRKRCGTPLEAQLISVALPGGEGDDQLFRTAVIDITEHRQTAEALRKSELKYRALYNSMAEGFAFFALLHGASGPADYQVLDVNRAFETITGIERSKVIGCRGATLGKDGVPPFLHEFASVASSGRPIIMEAVPFFGKPALRLSVFSPARGSFAIVFEDISERIHAEEDLQRAYDELEKRVSERTGLLARTIDALQKEIQIRRETEKALRSSDERYSLAVAGAADGIWDWDIGSGEVYLSPRWKEMLGYGDNELPNQIATWRSAIHPEDLERVDSSLRAYLDGTTPCYQVEQRLRHRNGSYRWILTKGACLRDDGGNAYRMAGSHTDITERKLAEEQVLRINHLYAVLSETNKAIVRSGSRLALLNDVCRVAVEHGGFSLAWVGILNRGTGIIEPIAADGVRRDCLSRVTITEEGDEVTPVIAALREGRCQYSNVFLDDAVTTALAGAGSVPFHSAAAVPFAIDGERKGILALYAAEEGFFHQQMIELLDEMAADISFALERFDRDARHREAEQALQAETARRLQAVEALREREQMLMHQSRLAAIGEMIGNIAHQWRQPLNTLGLYLQGMTVGWELGEFDRREAQETIAKAMQVIYHMSQTIDDFRYFFKPDKEKVPFRARDLVAKTVSLMDGSYRDQHIALHVIEDEDPELVGYPNEYSQVLLNILSNARDAIVERQVPEPRVVVRLAREDGRSVVTIADNAGGIPLAIIDKIFDPYFSTKDPDRGTGVGLFISKTIIEKNMGGRLTVRNRDGGAEFRIEV